MTAACPGGGGQFGARPEVRKEMALGSIRCVAGGESRPQSSRPAAVLPEVVVTRGRGDPPLCPVTALFWPRPSVTSRVREAGVLAPPLVLRAARPVVRRGGALSGRAVPQQLRRPLVGPEGVRAAVLRQLQAQRLQPGPGRGVLRGRLPALVRVPPRGQQLPQPARQPQEAPAPEAAQPDVQPLVLGECRRALALPARLPPGSPVSAKHPCSQLSDGA